VPGRLGTGQARLPHPPTTEMDRDVGTPGKRFGESPPERVACRDQRDVPVQVLASCHGMNCNRLERSLQRRQDTPLTVMGRGERVIRSRRMGRPTGR
jgi:hypothetical protein